MRKQLPTFILCLISTACQTEIWHETHYGTDKNCWAKLRFSDHETQLSASHLRTIKRVVQVALTENRVLFEQSPSPVGSLEPEIRMRQSRVLEVLGQYEAQGLRADSGFQVQDSLPSDGILIDACKRQGP